MNIYNRYYILHCSCCIPNDMLASKMISRLRIITGDTRDFFRTSRKSSNTMQSLSAFSRSEGAQTSNIKVSVSQSCIPEMVGFHNRRIQKSVEGEGEGGTEKNKPNTNFTTICNFFFLALQKEISVHTCSSNDNLQRLAWASRITHVGGQSSRLQVIPGAIDVRPRVIHTLNLHKNHQIRILP